MILDIILVFTFISLQFFIFTPVQVACVYVKIKVSFRAETCVQNHKFIFDCIDHQHYFHAVCLHVIVLSIDNSDQFLCSEANSNFVVGCDLWILSIVMYVNRLPNKKQCCVHNDVEQIIFKRIRKNKSKLKYFLPCCG